MAIPRIVVQQLVAWMEVVELYEASLAAVRWTFERNLLVRVDVCWRWRSVPKPCRPRPCRQILHGLRLLTILDGIR